MRNVFGAMLLLPLVGCVSTQQSVPPHHHVDYWEAQGMKRAGEGFVHEGYFQNGVTVTPSKNFFYGQGKRFDPQDAVNSRISVSAYETPGGTPVTPQQAERQNLNAPANNPSVHPPLPDGGQKLLASGEEINEISAQYGGMVTPGSLTAARRQTYSSLQEQAAQRAIGIYGRYINWGTTTPYARLDEETINGLLSKPDALGFNEGRILALLDRMLPNEVSPLQGEAITGRSGPTALFDLGKSDVRPRDKEQLMKFATAMKSYDNLLIVGGYTDDIGDNEINEPLADNRALSVAKVLIDGGINERVLLLYGKHKCCYIKSNETPEQRQQNRRVAIEVGGMFDRLNVTDAEGIATSLARVFKTIRGNNKQKIRVYGLGPTEDAAKAQAARLKSFLTSPAIGVENVEVGHPGMSDKPEVVIEIVGQLGDK